LEKNQLAHLPVERAGVALLKLRLPPISSKLLTSKFPRLQQEVAEKRIGLCTWRSRNEPDQHLTVHHLRKALWECMPSLRSQITYRFKAQQDAVHKVEKRIDLEWAGKKMKEDAFSIPYVRATSQRSSASMRSQSGEELLGPLHTGCA